MARLVCTVSMRVKIFSFLFLNHTYYTIDLSTPKHLLGIGYDSLDDLIYNIQLHTSIQGYSICRFCIKKSSRIGLLEICYLCYD